jgi:hypothetical protein
MSNFRNFEKVIIGAYRWLSDVYQDGDRIFLFGTNSLGSGAKYSQTFLLGFSRGAYQVRALAAMIKMVSPVCHLFFARLGPQILCWSGWPHPSREPRTNTIVIPVYFLWIILALDIYSKQRVGAVLEQ